MSREIEAVRALELTDAQAVENTIDSITESGSVAGAATSGFEDFMARVLGREGTAEISEEELFSALIENRLSERNPEAAAYYSSQKDSLLSSLRRADGYVSYEDAASKALDATIESGLINAEDGSAVRSEAFRAAQLDSDLTKLYDNRGSAQDPTKAVAAMESALFTSRKILEQIDSGEIDPGEISTEEPNSQLTSSTSGQTSDAVEIRNLDGANGFLWKPVSESDGNLVVLLPTDLKGNIDRVEIHSGLPATADTFLEKGSFAGDTHNGGRSHFRFTQPGANYGDNLNLVVYRDDGSNVVWEIADGADRND